MICDWNTPGQDRYTGTAEAAIRAFALPSATQQDLISKFEQRQIEDTVVIDRDSIRGIKHEYAPQIRSMHFGSAGRVCDVRDRAWPGAHTETALVFCSGSTCIAWPAVCGNWFIVTRLPGAPTALVPPVYASPPGAIPVAPGTPTFGAPGTPAADVPVVPVPQLPVQQTFLLTSNSVSGSISFAPLSPIPEPSSWALMLAGLALFLRRNRWSTRNTSPSGSSTSLATPAQ